MSATTASSSTPITRVAALGGGLIGQSWVALFLAAGLEVSVYDIDPGTDERRILTPGFFAGVNARL